MGLARKWSVSELACLLKYWNEYGPKAACRIVNAKFKRSLTTHAVAGLRRRYRNKGRVYPFKVYAGREAHAINKQFAHILTEDDIK